MGVLPVARGGVSLDGADITRLAPHQRAARMAYAAGARHLRAADGRREHTDGHGDQAGARAAHQEEVFELFPVLRGMLSRRGGDLSGGQQQQLAIARALVAEPRLIILDEPTEGIQPSIIKDIGRVIRMLRQRGDIGILLCEQYFDFARELADRYMVLSRGESWPAAAAKPWTARTCAGICRSRQRTTPAHAVRAGVRGAFRNRFPCQRDL